MFYSKKPSKDHKSLLATENLSSFKSEGKSFFKDLNLDEALLHSLDSQNFKHPTEIQSLTIPSILEGKDLIAQAKTGSGKTLAFALPSLQKIGPSREVSVLVLTPTRELAQQVADVYKNFGKSKNIKSTCIVGRESYTKQISDVNNGAHVVIATPGRLLDLIESKKFRKFNPSMVILDEADEMLNMGFIDDIRTIFAKLSKDRQTVFFSATFPEQILRLAKSELKDPSVIRIDFERKDIPSSIEQNFFILKDFERKDALVRLLDSENPEKSIVFCRTKGETEILQSFLVQRKFKAKVLHGDLSQTERNRSIKDFKEGVYNVLIATDIASRGIDIDDLTHVFNFNIPENYDRYTHRIGRTGRAGRDGKAYTLTTMNEWKSHRFLRAINTQKIQIGKIPSKKQVQEQTYLNLMEQIKKSPCSKVSQKLCKNMLLEIDQFEFMCKLFTFVSNEYAISGPDDIGMENINVRDFSYNSGRKSFPRRSKDFSSRRASNRPNRRRRR